MKYIPLTLLVGCLLCSCTRVKIHYMPGPLQDIFAKAQLEHKKVFILIGNSKCGQCKHFDSLIQEQATTVNILKDQYICYKVDILDSLQRAIAQITKCPSYPFPYFFDNEGNLLALGFPDSREYDITDLSKIGVDEYRFKELFHLPISTDDYKSLVSLNLRAFLLMNKEPTEKNALDSAFKMVTRSVNITSYPFNLWLSYQLANRLGYRSYKVSGQMPLLSGSERIIYGSIIDSIKRISSGSPIASRLNDSIGYVFFKEKLDCGQVKKGTDYPFSFEFKNTGKKELLIARAEHPCSCIELTWPQNAIRPGETGSIQGVFHARELGTFSKDVFVHATTAQIPMRTVILTGTVF